MKSGKQRPSMLSSPMALKRRKKNLQGGGGFIR